MPAWSRARRPEDLPEHRGGYVIKLRDRLTVECAGRDVTPPEGAQAMLVQVLAAYDGSLHQEQLSALLWPYVARRRDRQGRLRNVLDRLEARVGPLVGRDGEDILFIAPVVIQM